MRVLRIRRAYAGGSAAQPGLSGCRTNVEPRTPRVSIVIVAEARRNSDARAQTYREQALKLFPWICGRCAREFDRSTSSN